MRRVGLPFMTQKHVVEIVIDHEQLLCQLLTGDAWDELQDPLLHGSARAVQLLQGEEVRQSAKHPAKLFLKDRVPAWLCPRGVRGLQTGL
jgi:hypothetical protein